MTTRLLPMTHHPSGRVSPVRTTVMSHDHASVWAGPWPIATAPVPTGALSLGAISCRDDAEPRCELLRTVPGTAVAGRQTAGETLDTSTRHGTPSGPASVARRVDANSPGEMSPPRGGAGEPRIQPMTVTTIGEGS